MTPAFATSSPALKMDHSVNMARVDAALRSQLEEHRCPITLELMVDPVAAPDGRLYEREAITRWLDTTNRVVVGRSPATNNMMVGELVAVHPVRSAIEALVEGAAPARLHALWNSRHRLVARRAFAAFRGARMCRRPRRVRVRAVRRCWRRMLASQRFQRPPQGMVRPRSLLRRRCLNVAKARPHRAADIWPQACCTLGWARIVHFSQTRCSIVLYALTDRPHGPARPAWFMPR